jgi:hypothetical protein
MASRDIEANSTRTPGASTEGILELGFDNVLPGHGELVIGAVEKFRPAIEAYANRAR